MKTITIEIPEGKKAKWVDGVLTLVDEQPVEFKFKVGDKVFCTTDSFVYTILDRYIFNGEPWYKVDESGLDGCSEYELEPYTEPKDITERIKTFEDACKWCNANGHGNLVTDYLRISNLGYVADIEAYLKLRIITCALNEGWEPTWAQGESRFYSYTDFNESTIETYFERHNTIHYHMGAKLAFKSSKLASYAATQFKDIYMDFCYKISISTT